MQVDITELHEYAKKLVDGLHLIKGKTVQDHDIISGLQDISKHVFKTVDAIKEDLIKRQSKEKKK